MVVLERDAQPQEKKGSYTGVLCTILGTHVQEGLTEAGTDAGRECKAHVLREDSKILALLAWQKEG